jgi:hypothetical protein
MPQRFARWMPKSNLWQTGSRISKAADRPLVKSGFLMHNATSLVTALLY